MPRKSKRNYKKQYATKKFVKKYLNSKSETKHGGQSLNFSAISTSGLELGLTNISVGPANFQRVGNEVMFTQYNYQLQFAGGDGINKIRMVIYRPRSSIDALISGSPTTNLNFLSPIDPDKYIVYEDKVIPMIFGSSNQISVRQRVKRWSGGTRIKWGDTADLIPTDNPIRVYFVSDSAVIPHPTISGYFQIHYKDL